MQGRKIFEGGGEFMGVGEVIIMTMLAISAVLMGISDSFRRIFVEKTGKISADIFSNAPRIAFCVDTG